MSRWRLQPLLDLRRRQGDQATGALGRALATCRASRDEADALWGRAEELARLALGDPEPRWPADAGTLASASHGSARLRLEAAGHRRQASEVETRALGEAEAVEACRLALRRAALGREVVERLEVAWRRTRAVEAARRDEARLDDRPWPAGAVNASRSAGSRPGPGRTGWRA